MIFNPTQNQIRIPQISSLTEESHNKPVETSRCLNLEDLTFMKLLTDPNYFSKFVHPAQIHQNYWLRLTKKSEFGGLAGLPRFFSQHPTIQSTQGWNTKHLQKSVRKSNRQISKQRHALLDQVAEPDEQYTADKEGCPRGLSHRGCVSIRRGSRIPGYSPTSKRHFLELWDNNYLITRKIILFCMCWKLNHCRGWNQISISTYKVTLWSPIFQN